jgi:hypothetical protein
MVEYEMMIAISDAPEFYLPNATYIQFYRFFLE